MRKDLKLIGAAAERKAILRKLRLEASLFPDYSTTRQELEQIILWLLKRHDRYDRAQGGLGRKRKGV